MNLPLTPWIRASAMAGNGNGAGVVGTGNFCNAFAWINEGAPIDLNALTGAVSAAVVNAKGSRAPLNSGKGVLLGNALQGTAPSAFHKFSGPNHCTDLPLSSGDGLDHCTVEGATWVEANFGLPGQNISCISDDGRVLISRVGSFFTGFTGFTGFMRVEDAGWIGLNEFFRKQDVVEAEKYGMGKPLAISGQGSTLVGGLSSRICRQVKAGAKMGRCEIK